MAAASRRRPAPRWRPPTCRAALAGYRRHWLPRPRAAAAADSRRRKLPPPLAAIAEDGRCHRRGRWLSPLQPVAVALLTWRPPPAAAGAVDWRHRRLDAALPAAAGCCRRPPRRLPPSPPAACHPHNCCRWQPAAACAARSFSSPPPPAPMLHSCCSLCLSLCSTYLRFPVSFVCSISSLFMVQASHHGLLASRHPLPPSYLEVTLVGGSVICARHKNIAYVRLRYALSSPLRAPTVKGPWAWPMQADEIFPNKLC